MKKIPEFKKIKKIALKKNFQIYTLNKFSNDLKILTHSYSGDAQIIKIKYKNSIKKY